MRHAALILTGILLASCSTAHAPKEPTVESQQAPIVVTSPQAGDTVSSPITLQGEAMTFEQTVQYRLRNAKGKVVAHGFTTAGATDVGKHGPFAVKIFFQNPATTEGTLEVYEESMEDGSDLHLVSIPLQFTLPKSTAE